MDVLCISPCRLENTKSAILPELVELTNDEESNVRITGLDTVVNILPMLDSGRCLDCADFFEGVLEVLCTFDQDAVHCQCCMLLVLVSVLTRIPCLA